MAKQVQPKKPVPEYVYVEALTADAEPWGMEGVWEKRRVDIAIKKDGKPILNWHQCIVGTGPGWEPDTVFDKAWIKEACKRMKGWKPR